MQNTVNIRVEPASDKSQTRANKMAENLRRLQQKTLEPFHQQKESGPKQQSSPQHYGGQEEYGGDLLPDMGSILDNYSIKLKQVNDTKNRLRINPTGNSSMSPSSRKVKKSRIPDKELDAKFQGIMKQCPYCNSMQVHRNVPTMLSSFSNEKSSTDSFLLSASTNVCTEKPLLASPF